MKRILLLTLLATTGLGLFAGNPDRRGEGGAYELNMNGYARSTGFWAMNSASVSGIEAERLNVGGLGRTQSMDVNLGYSLWLQGTGVGVVQFGLAQNFKQDNVIGFSINALNLGEMIKTTTALPQDGLGTFKSTYINIGLSYARAFSNSIYGGATMRLVNEGIANVNATGFAIDFGLQYVTGPKDNIHFGVSIRNIGTPMKFSGDGLTFQQTALEGEYKLSIDNKSASFNLPTSLNVGASYDFLFGRKVELPNAKYKQDHRFTILANFTSNAFGNDYFGGGIEYSWKDQFMVRGAYRYETGITSKTTTATVYNGLAAGASFETPFKKDGSGTRLGIDYSFRMSYVFSGTHTMGLHFNLGQELKKKVKEVSGPDAFQQTENLSKKEKKKQLSIVEQKQSQIDSLVQANKALEVKANTPIVKIDTVVKTQTVVKVDTVFVVQELKTDYKGGQIDTVSEGGKTKLKFKDFNNLEFETGSATIRNKSFQYLNYLVNTMIKNPKATLRLEGHTDNNGDAAKNMTLSEERVNVVKKYFVSSGIKASRIITQAFGDTRPKVPNSSEANKQINRRVEITEEF